MRRRNHKAQGEGGLLFVVKDATNVSSRTTNEAFSINSHVQRQRKEKFSKSTNRDPEIDSLQQILGHKASKANEIASAKHRWRIKPVHLPSKQGDTSKLPDGNKEPIRDPKPLSSANPPGHLALRPKWTTRASELTQVLLNPSPVTILKKGNSDPFNATSVPISPKLNDLVLFARDLGGFMIWPAETILRDRSSIVRSWSQEVNSYIQDPDYFQSWLTYSATLKATVHEAERENLLAEALAFKGESIARLRNRMITKGLDFETLSIVVHHFGAEFYTKNLVAAMTHLRAAKDMTDAMGGIHSIPQLLKEIILTSAVIVASICLCRPLWDVQEWDPGTVETAAQRVPVTDRAIIRLTSAMKSCKRLDIPLHSSVTDSELQVIFEDLRELFHVEDYKCRVLSMSEKIDDKIFRWLHLRKLACWARLLEYYITIAKPPSLFERLASGRRLEHPEDQNCFPAMLCVAAIYAETIVFRHPRLPSAHTRYNGLLQIALTTCLRQLEEINTVGGEEHKSGILWALAMGTLDEVTHRWTEDRSWHSITFANLAWKMKLRSLEDLKRSCLMRFVYCEREMDPILLTIMSNLEEWVNEADVRNFS